MFASATQGGHNNLNISDVSHVTTVPVTNVQLLSTSARLRLAHPSCGRPSCMINVQI